MAQTAKIEPGDIFIGFTKELQNRRNDGNDIHLPLGDTLAFRASGFYNKNGGFIDSIGTSGTSFTSLVTSDVADNINKSQTYGGRASLLFKPSDVFNIRLTAHVQNIRADAPSVVESDPNTLRTLYGIRFSMPLV